MCKRGRLRVNARDFPTLERTSSMDMQGSFKDAASVVPLGERLYKPPVTANVTHDAPGIPSEPCCNTQAQAEQARDKRTEVLLPLHEAQRGGPFTLRPQHRMLPTVRWKEGWLMQDGTHVPDPVCGRCNKKID